VLAVIIAAAACSSGKSTTKPSLPSGVVALPNNLRIAGISYVPAQTINGFGASGAWWPIDLATFPESTQQEVVQMLFSSSGIALSGYRYNIGGGGAGVKAANRAPKQYPADTAGLTFLKAAHDAGVPILTGFVNSAPPRFTTNGKACGGQLKPGMESEYAAYLAGVVRSLRDNQHIGLQYVSPMNEPDDSFPDCGQEGMSVPVDQRAKVVQALGAALAREAPFAKVIADETTADAIAAKEVPEWLQSGATRRYLAAIAHHTYDFPNNGLRALIPAVSKQTGLPTWMTEICCYKGSGGVANGFGAHYDPTMTQGLWLADQIAADFEVAGDRAWYWWTALSPVLGCDPHADASCPTRENNNGFNDGLLYYDEHGATDGVTKIFPTKRFYVLGQFSRYVRPGAVRHAVEGTPPGVHAMAFASGHGWTVVTWNESAKNASYGLRVPNLPTAENAITTNASNDLTQQPPPQHTAAGIFIIKLPPRTVTTYTFLGRS
jgi:O-glycosyl hydrolase